MSSSLPLIATLTLVEVQRSIKSFVAVGKRPDTVAAYVASVDWSGATGDEPVAQLLGAVEHLTEEFAERDISEQEFWFELGQVVSRLPAAVG